MAAGGLWRIFGVDPEAEIAAELEPPVGKKWVCDPEAAASLGMAVHAEKGIVVELGTTTSLVGRAVEEALAEAVAAPSRSARSVVGPGEHPMFREHKVSPRPVGGEA
jgi:hypothetical protein